MKKNFLHIFTILAAALSLLACTREPNLGEEEGEGIVLDFLCVSPTTRAGMNGTREGEDAWNENLINTLDVFLYNDSMNCIIHRRFTPNNSSGKTTVSVFTDDGLINTLVPDGNVGFWVYAIANYPGTLVTNENNLSSYTIDYLKSLPLECNFSAPANHRQPSFVMDGLSLITTVDKTKRIVAKGEVGLKRVAAKITVQLNIAEGIEIAKTAVINDVPVPYYERWEPMLDGEHSIQMYIENAVFQTTMAAKPISVTDDGYFSYKNNKLYFTRSTDEADADYPWVTDPTYVYPQHWEYASKVAPTKEPTIKLILPWRRISRMSNGIQVNATQKQFYYKIIIPDDTRADDGDDSFLRNFVRNNWYNFKMEVGMLGSETDDAAVMISGHYYVVDWQDKNVVEKQAAIGKARFLSISPKEHTLYNENTLDMLYTSSHPVALNTEKNGTTLDITATKAYYGEKTAGTSYGGGTIRTADANHPDYASGQKYIEYSASQRKALNNNEDWVKVDGDYVKFTHTLNNNISSGESFDSAPYIIRFSLYHADHAQDGLYKQSIKITQYPAIYITSAVSNGAIFVKGTGNESKVNSITDDASNDIGSIVANSSITGTGTNVNKNLYDVHVTVLPSDSPYMIGDPRTNGSTAVVTTLTGLNDNANYRPAAENTQSIIAPSIKIASSYGKTSATYYENARTRCAAYQESGFPAGRWRLPTDAEIKYLVMLSEQGVIPSLFEPGGDSVTSGSGWNQTTTYYYSYYWAGGYEAYYDDGFINMQGRQTGSISGVGTQGYNFSQQIGNRTYTYHFVYTRCVYDIWYWGEDPDSNHLDSWGDYQTTK